jgi:hypothetical protein
MPKKRSAKDQARLYTAAQRTRLQPSKQPDEPLKDVTTQLHELRMEQARERPVSSSVTSIHQPTLKSSLGFLPATYTATEDICDETQPARRIPGPAPPRSWTERRRIARQSAIPMLARSRSEPVSPFSSVDAPRPGPLVHHCLLTLGTHYFEHQKLNKYYLPQLGLQIKQWLLTYIAARQIGGAITRDGLDVLFPHAVGKDDPEEMKDIVAMSKRDEVHLRHLDLADSLSLNFTIRQLKSFLSPTDAIEEEIAFPDVSEWILEAPRFPNLTHLSLDIYPIRPAQFDLISLAQTLSQNCTRLTHLSLAGVFNSVTPSNTSAARTALILLSRSLVCLEYIDLSYCTVLGKYGHMYPPRPVDEERRVQQHVYHSGLWDDDVSAHDNASGLLGQLNWGGAWRNVRFLVIKRCGFTLEMQTDIRDQIMERRGGKGWIYVMM